MKGQPTIIKPAMIRWLRQRTELSLEDFARRMRVAERTVRQWENGEKAITMNQAQRLSSLALVPFGLLFLEQIPQRNIVLPDFRSIGGTELTRCSPELESTILEMQEKQGWYKSHLEEDGAEPLDFIGSIGIRTPSSQAVGKLYDVLDLQEEEIADCRTWEQFSRLLQESVEKAGILLMRNGVAGMNTRRPLDVEEFRGFVLADELAPLIFINSRDFPHAQTFTLIHELVHLLLGKSGLVDVDLYHGSKNRTEQYCNQVAAEFLVPQERLRALWKQNAAQGKSLEENLACLAREFKVSRMVLLIRCRDLDLITPKRFSSVWRELVAAIRTQRQRQGGGGDFYRTLISRVGDNFARYIISETAARRIPCHDAFRLLHVKNMDGLIRFSQEFGMPML